MEYKDFNAIVEAAKNRKTRKTVAVIEAGEEHTIDAVKMAWDDGIIAPALIGKKAEILELLGDSNIPQDYIIDSPSPEESARIAVKLVRDGKADFLMKGLAETSQIMKAILNRETGIRTGRTISQVVFVTMDTYHKLLCITDPSIVADPTLEKKKDMTQNAVDVMKNLGYEKPKVGAICAIEKVNPGMIETVEAAELKRMADEGIIRDCEFEGPISLDLALEPGSAAIKKYTSPVAGDADIVLMPTLAAANIFAKALRIFAKSTNVGVMLGAQVPMVLVSRSTDTKAKYTSLAVVSEMV